MTMLNFQFCPHFRNIPKFILSRHNLFKQGPEMMKNTAQKVKHFVSHVGTNYMQEKLSLRQQ